VLQIVSRRPPLLVASTNNIEAAIHMQEIRQDSATVPSVESVAGEVVKGKTAVRHWYLGEKKLELI
jgi:hypothetical protein